MQITDDSLIDVSVSGRLGSLQMSFSEVKAKWLIRFFGEESVEDARDCLERLGEWAAQIGGGWLFLKTLKN